MSQKVWIEDGVIPSSRLTHFSILFIFIVFPPHKRERNIHKN